MKIYTLHRRQTLPISLEQAWPFFSHPQNLEEITPAFLNFRITSAVPEEIYNGLIITYQIAAVAGIPMTWVTEIKQVERFKQFVDEQRIGPYRFWHHLHQFQEIEGGIEMEDIVHYVMPWGWLGRIVHWIFVRQRLEAIFEFRRAYLSQKFSSQFEKA